jgi:DNA-binding MarR family transcriptional regulator
MVRSHGQSDLVTTGQYDVLVLLQHGPLTLRGLADREKVRPPWMTRTVDALESQRLVARSADPTDGRQVLVSLTSSGRDLIEATRRRRTEWLEERLSVLTAAQRETLAQAAALLLDLTA